MVKRRTDRSFLPAAGCSVTRVRFPVCPAQRALPPTHQASETGNSDGWPRCSSTSTEERTGSDGWNQLGDPGSDGGSGETESKRGRQDGNEQAATPTNRDGVPGSCDPAGDVPGPDQQGAAEDSRAAELQSTGSLKVTIQRSSDSREFGQTDKTTERQTCGLHCYVCNLTCRSAQVFQEHMSGQEHLRKLQEITHCIHLNTNTLLDRGRRSETQRWCDSCQIHFSGDVIKHRRTRQHKVCKQLCRPFCPVCKRHFRTPRKFVEHMKSAEHKQQVSWCNSCLESQKRSGTAAERPQNEAERPHNEVEQVQNKVERPRNEAVRLQNEVERLPNEVEQLHNEVERLQNEVEQLQNEGERLQNEVEWLHNEVERLQNEGERLQNEVEQLQNEVEQPHNEVEQPHNEVEQPHNEVERLQNEVERLQNGCRTKWNDRITKWNGCRTKRNGRITKWNGCRTKWNGCRTKWNGRITKWNGCRTKWNGRITKWNSCRTKWNSRITKWNGCRTK
ncbi:cdkn1a interacting zinc finger protein 1b isoform X1 [Melanotaenia boesemani]|uniref:cdkn1a interacting zinc finger protein 1b isoform X1 n=2 Tax=Melanotaenia boesemani TaxID=1250792 RepID=UPI001C050125|nr:cdkn1a interacting zinc finger protein 1b isoform X1 [Melanotaenia boesemani]